MSLNLTKGIIEVASQTSEKDRLTSAENSALWQLLAKEKTTTTTTNFSEPNSTLMNNKWKILAKEIKSETDLKRNANEKRLLHSAKRWKR